MGFLTPVKTMITRSLAVETFQLSKSPLFLATDELLCFN